jgi:hypothetical protein
MCCALPTPISGTVLRPSFQNWSMEPWRPFTSLCRVSCEVAARLTESGFHLLRPLGSEASSATLPVACSASSSALALTRMQLPTQGSAPLRARSISEVTSLQMSPPLPLSSGLLASLLFATLLAPSAHAFTCCTQEHLGSTSCLTSQEFPHRTGTANDPAQCAALGELFSNDFGAGPLNGDLPPFGGWANSAPLLGGDYSLTTQSSDSEHHYHGWMGAYYDTPTDYCTFVGITCSAGLVTSFASVIQSDPNSTFAFPIGVGGKGLPESIGNLTSLTSLSLRYGKLNGTLPSTLGCLTNLQFLDLRGNRLSGSIPTSLSSLTQLTALLLSEPSDPNELNVFDGPPLALDGMLATLYSLKAPNVSISVSYLSQFTHLLTLIFSGEVAAATVTLQSDLVLTSPLALFSSTLTMDGNTSACLSGRAAGSSLPPLCTLTAAPPVEERRSLLGCGAGGCGGGGYLRHFVLSSSSLSLFNVALLNGSDTLSGGSIYADAQSSLFAQNCTFAGNAAGSFGGAIFIESSDAPVDLRYCTFTNNTQTQTTLTGLNSIGGGAIYSNAPVLLTSCSFVHNSVAQGKGGAIGAESVFDSNSTFVNNSAMAGGAVSLKDFDFSRETFHESESQVSPSLMVASLQGSVFVGNSASAGSGGAIESSVAGTTITAIGSTFTANRAALGGGALFADGLQLTNCTLSGNLASAASGGAVQTISSLDASLSEVVLLNNRAQASGGALSFTSASQGMMVVTLVGITCSGNSGNSASADEGGGCIRVSDGAGVSISNSTISLNVAGGGSGGGIWAGCTVSPCQQVLSISGTTLSSNTAGLQGGAAYVRGSAVFITNTTLSSNTASGHAAQGGGLFLLEWGGLALPPVMLSNVNFSSNMVILTEDGAAPGTVELTPSGAGLGGSFFVRALVSASLNLSAVQLCGGRAQGGAGGFVYGNTSLSISASTLCNNTALGDGGALLLQASSDGTQAPSAYLTNCTVSGNTAARGAAIALNSGSAVYVSTTTTFSGNGNMNTLGAVFALLVNGQNSTVGAPTLSLSGLNASGNVAFSGGFLYTDSLRPIPLPTFGFTLSNTAVNGPVYASPPTSFNSTAGSSTITARSGALLPPLSLSMYDAFGQKVVQWPGLYATIAAASSTSGGSGIVGLSGSTTVFYQAGQALFSELKLSDAIGSAYNLTYTLSSSELGTLNGASGTLAAAVASCASFDPLSVYSPSTLSCVCGAGSFLNASSLVCALCPPGSYSPVPGAVSCTTNPPGFVSSTLTTFTGLANLSGISVSALASAQNGSLAAVIASTLNAPLSTVAITSVTEISADPLLTGRRSLALSPSISVGYSVATTNATLTTALRSLFYSTSSFANSLSSVMRSSLDVVLRQVTSVAAGPVQQTDLALAVEPCQPGTFLNVATQSCESCPDGLVTTSPGQSTCISCPPRYAWVNSSLCSVCPPNSITSPRSAAACACVGGYFDSLFGEIPASPSCDPCPIGGVCISGYLGAAEGYWRVSNVSANLYKCRVGNCEQEIVDGPLSVENSNAVAEEGRDPNARNCVFGNTGPLCALCAPGFALQSGRCGPCNADDAWTSWSERSQAALLSCCIAFGVFVITILFFQPLSPQLEAAVTSCFTSVKVTMSSATTCGKKETSGSDSGNSKEEHATHHGAARVGVLAAAAALASEAVDGTLTDAADTALQMATSGNDIYTMDEQEEEHVPTASLIFKQIKMLRALMRDATDVSKIVINFYQARYLSVLWLTAPSLASLRFRLICALTSCPLIPSLPQIVSTFLKSLDIPWPHFFGVIMARVNIVNLNLVQLPKAACLNPTVSYYKQFNGKTRPAGKTLPDLPHDSFVDRLHTRPHLCHSLDRRFGGVWHQNCGTL